MIYKGIMAYSEEKKQENRELAARRRAYVADKFGSLMNLMGKPAEMVEDFATGGEGYSESMRLPFGRRIEHGAVDDVKRFVADPLLYAGGGLASGARQAGRAALNAPNYLRGFYSGQKASATAEGIANTGWNSLRQFLSPQASANFKMGKSLGTTEILQKNLDQMQSIQRKLDNGMDVSPDEFKLYHDLGKQIGGQMGANVLIAKQAGAVAPILKKWQDAVYHDIDKFTQKNFIGSRQYAGKASQNVPIDDMEIAYDIISGTWKTKITKEGLTPQAIMAIKKHRGPRMVGAHDRDVISSEEFNRIKDVLTKEGVSFKAPEDLANALENVKISPVKVDDDGVWVQFSPQRKSGLAEGGTNAILKIGKDRKVTMFITDENDIFGMVPPGYDRMVTALPPWKMDFFAKVEKGARRGTQRRSSKDDFVRASENIRRYETTPIVKKPPQLSESTRTGRGQTFNKAQQEALREFTDLNAPIDWGNYLRRRGGVATVGAGILEDLK